MAGAEVDLRGVRAAILGWAGCRERQLRTVARWYRERGAMPVVACARIARAMSRPWGWSIEGRALASRLEGATRVVVHLFSNSGFWAYAALLEERPDLPVEAVVIDSAPGFGPWIRPRSYSHLAARAFTPILLRALGRPPALAHPALTPPLRAFMRFWYHMSTSSIRFAERSLSVVARPAPRPHLLIYSPADTLVAAEHVEAFARRLRPVEVLRFEGSEHVRHMVAHRAAYFEGVAGFLASHVGAAAARGAAG